MNLMRAISVQPGVAGSLRLEEFRVPPPQRGAVLVRAVALGVCGTDHDILAGKYGSPPPGHERLILGHESLGRVEDAPAGSGFSAGDLVVGIVRHPDPVPCANCAAGEWDMCRNGQFTEHGIGSLDGFGSEFYRLDPEFVVRIPSGLGIHGVLVEPASIVAKAWQHIEHIGSRARWSPRKVLVTGGGPVGLLAALFGIQRGLEVHIFDRNTDGPKPDLIRMLGATHRTGTLDDLERDFDVVLECTAAGALVAAVVEHTAPDGIVCLLGVSTPGERESIDVGQINLDVVLGNRVVFGSVNANRTHYELAVEALQAADATWLDCLISRRVPIDRWREAFEHRPDDVKTIVVFDEESRPA
jgi:threonine dehydrogenase-like Zn-dependent dehydrogenase